jgi:hypothetical protein
MQTNFVWKKRKATTKHWTQHNNQENIPQLMWIIQRTVINHTLLTAFTNKDSARLRGIGPSLGPILRQMQEKNK